MFIPWFQYLHDSYTRCLLVIKSACYSSKSQSFFLNVICQASLCAWECFRVLEKCMLESRWLHACPPTGEFPTPSRPSSLQPGHLIHPRFSINLKHSSDKVIPLGKAVNSSSWDKEKTAWLWGLSHLWPIHLPIFPSQSPTHTPKLQTS